MGLENPQHMVQSQDIVFQPMTFPEFASVTMK
jgi:hypothetical protein